MSKYSDLLIEAEESELEVPFTTARKSISWVAGANFVKEHVVWVTDSDGNTCFEEDC